MDDENGTIDNAVNACESNVESQEIDSNFRLVVIAALRNKQLQKGAPPRVEKDLGRRRNTNIAIEEVKRGLIYFKNTDNEGVIINKTETPKQQL